MDHICKVIQENNFSKSTEKTYMAWISRFVKFHKKIDLENLEAKDIQTFLMYLDENRKVSASTQNQALNALMFLFKKVLNKPLDKFHGKHAKIGSRLPVIFSCDEAQNVLSNLHGDAHLMASLLYGSGLRLRECFRLRIQDIDFEKNKIIVRTVNGEIDRISILPNLLVAQLCRQIEKTTLVWEENMMEKEFAGASLPESLQVKDASVAKEMSWQYVFPAKKLSKDPVTGKLRQHFCHESYLQKAVKTAIKKARVFKKASCHTFRHSFATRLLESGYDIRTVQKLIGHKDVRTTMIYMRVRDKNKLKVQSPLDM